MYKKLELIGSSEIDFNNAITNIINELCNKNYHIYQFKVLEQRGILQNNTLVFQVTLSLEVEFEEHLCLQDNKQSKIKNEGSEVYCEWCGCSMTIPNENTSEKLNHTFVCNSCGRIISVSDRFRSKLK